MLNARRDLQSSPGLVSSETLKIIEQTYKHWLARAREDFEHRILPQGSAAVARLTASGPPKNRRTKSSRREDQGTHGPDSRIAPGTTQPQHQEQHVQLPQLQPLAPRPTGDNSRSHSAFSPGYPPHEMQRQQQVLMTDSFPPGTTDNYPTWSAHMNPGTSGVMGPATIRNAVHQEISSTGISSWGGSSSLAGQPYSRDHHPPLIDTHRALHLGPTSALGPQQLPFPSPPLSTSEEHQQTRATHRFHPSPYGPNTRFHG